LPICQGSGWEPIGICSKEYCENGVICQKAGGGTAYTKTIRYRHKFKRMINENTWEYCKGSGFDDYVINCCDCNGVTYAMEPD